MKKGSFYEFIEGGIYVFDSIALPRESEDISRRDRDKMLHTHEAIHPTTRKWFNVYESGVATFIDSDVPHVLYQTKADFTEDRDYIYAMEVDKFFGQVETNTGKQSRFQIVE